MLKKLFSAACLIFIGILLGFVILEAGLRLIGVNKDLNGGVKNYYQADPKMGVDIAPNVKPGYDFFADAKIKVWSNELGCFDLPYHNEDDYILLVGDSFTWGYTPFEQKWGTLIEQLTGKRTLKCGVGGFGTHQELLKAEKTIALTKKSPKLIIVGYLGNDLSDDYLFPLDTVIDGRRVTRVSFSNIPLGTRHIKTDAELQASVKNWNNYCVTFTPRYPLFRRGLCILKQHTVSYGVLKKSMRGVLTRLVGARNVEALVGKDTGPQWEEGNIALIKEDTYPWIASAWEDQKKTIYEFQKLAHKENAQLLFVLIPLEEQVSPEQNTQLPQTVDLNQIHKTLIPFFEENNIAYIDLLSDFTISAQKGVDPHWKFNGHWNPQGNKLAGLLVSKYLLEKNMVRVPELEKQKKLSEIEKELSAFQ